VILAKDTAVNPAGDGVNGVVGNLLRIIKNIFFWRYERNTWQWDVLCVLILAFIFLTPKSWFESGERQLSYAHPKRVATVLIGAEVIANEGDRHRLQEHIRSLTGRAETEVVAVRRVVDDDGKTRGYEVDIR
jgi:hypothetical protein